MTRYEKYRVTVSKNGKEMVLYIPWNVLKAEVDLYLENCYTVTIDGGVMAKEEE